MRTRWLTRRAVLLHFLLVTVVPGCFLAGWWQVHRALNGNLLSYFYSVEWPIFAVLGVVAWWQLVHDERVDADYGEPNRTSRSFLHRDDEIPSQPLVWDPALETPELSAYNQYLRELSSGPRKTWRNPRGLPMVDAPDVAGGAGGGETALVNTPSTGSSPLGGTAGALGRYRVMAIIVGTGLAVLCFVGIPLQVVGMLVHGHDVLAGSSWSVNAGWPWTAVVAIVGTAHGFFYIVYLLSCLDLASRARLRTTQLLGMVGSGLLPLLAFYTERKVVQRVKPQLALGRQAPPGPAATVWAAVAGKRHRDADDD